MARTMIPVQNREERKTKHKIQKGGGRQHVRWRRKQEARHATGRRMQVSW